MDIPSFVIEKSSWVLHKIPDHPVQLIKHRIYDYFDSIGNFEFFDDFSPMTTTVDNFDRLFFPNCHTDRMKAYHISNELILRTHMTTHQNKLLSMGIRKFLVTGDVYRNEPQNWCHYPIFHQMDGLFVVPNNINVEKDLLSVLRGLISYLYPKIEYRINPAYFPHTDPSFDFELKYNGKWIEILGCGIVHSEILRRNAVPGIAWAFGLGLDRMAMVAYNIPNISHLWIRNGSDFPVVTYINSDNRFKSGIIKKYNDRRIYLSHHRRK